jgi:hypothetical protein
LRKELDEFKKVGMYFENQKELEELNQKLSMGQIDSLGYSRDNASKFGPLGGSSMRSKGSKKSNTDLRKQIEVYGDFQDDHITEYAERMEQLKLDIDK